MFAPLRIAAAAALSILVLAPSPASAAPAVLFDVGTGEVLHAHEPDRRWHPASLTKLMSVYVAFRHIEAGRLTMGSPVVFSQRAAAETANVTGWPAGTQVTVDEAIRVLMVKSAQDMSVAFAESISGSVEAFVAEMNAMAAELGMADTHFQNPHGLHDPSHVTTARDMAVLARALLGRYPQYGEVFAIPSMTLRGQEMRNFNILLGRFPGADGMKTGYVCSAGYNIVASATRQGRRLVAVVFGAIGEAERAEVATALLEAGFAANGEGPMLDALPASQGGPAVDMRPYTCGGEQRPAELANYGIDTTPPVPLPRPKPAG